MKRYFGTDVISSKLCIMSKPLISFHKCNQMLFTILGCDYTPVSCSKKPKWPASQCLLHQKSQAILENFTWIFATGNFRLHIIYRQSLFDRNTTDWAPFTLLTACTEMQISRKKRMHDSTSFDKKCNIMHGYKTSYNFVSNYQKHTYMRIMMP